MMIVVMMMIIVMMMITFSGKTDYDGVNRAENDVDDGKNYGM